MGEMSRVTQKFGSGPLDPKPLMVVSGDGTLLASCSEPGAGATAYGWDPAHCLPGLHVGFSFLKLFYIRKAVRCCSRMGFSLFLIWDDWEGALWVPHTFFCWFCARSSTSTAKSFCPDPACPGLSKWQLLSSLSVFCPEFALNRDMQFLAHPPANAGDCGA